jgi:protein involved in polysaccharide export with SLBB domain
MRPLPTYRIEPPDILQIEVTTAKGTPISGTPTMTPGSFGFGTMMKTGGGTLVLSGNNIHTGNATTGSTTVKASGSNTYTTTVKAGKPGQSNSQAIVKSGGPAATMPPGQAVAAVKKPSGPTANPTAKPSKQIHVNVGKTESKVAEDHCGQYLVAPDGTVNLHRYGTVQVMGKTVEEAAAAVRKQLSKYLPSPQVSVDVLAYNSKVYYIITEGAGLGDNVRRVPITGSDTVLDALGVVNGLSQVSSTRMWIARPSPSNPTNGTILPVDYAGITQRGATATNYQIMPGDRLFIAEDRTAAVNNWVTKKTTSVERVLGLISLGASTVESIEKLVPDQPKYPPGTTVPGQ